VNLSDPPEPPGTGEYRYTAGWIIEVLKLNQGTFSAWLRKHQAATGTQYAYTEVRLHPLGVGGVSRFYRAEVFEVAVRHFGLPGPDTPEFHPFPDAPEFCFSIHWMAENLGIAYATLHSWLALRRFPRRRYRNRGYLYTAEAYDAALARFPGRSDLGGILREFPWTTRTLAIAAGQRPKDVLNCLRYYKGPSSPPSRLAPGERGRPPRRYPDEALDFVRNYFLKRSRESDDPDDHEP
jgi:hypothetical protein